MARRYHHNRYHYRPHYNRHYNHRRRLRIPLMPIVAIISFLATLLFAPTFFFAPTCRVSYFERFLPLLCSLNNPLMIIFTIILLISSLIAINKIHLGYSDLGIWLMPFLSVALLFVAIVFWFGGDWGALVLILPSGFAAFRAIRRSGTFVYFGR